MSGAWRASKSLAECARQAWFGMARALCVKRLLLHLLTGDVKSRNPYECGLSPSCNVMILLVCAYLHLIRFWRNGSRATWLRVKLTESVAGSWNCSTWRCCPWSQV